MIKLILLAIWLVMVLYAPFELTRIILAVNSGQHYWVVPWFWMAELVAIWAGYLFIGIIIFNIKKGAER